MGIGSILGIVPKLFGLVDKAVLDKDAATKLKFDLQNTVMSYESELVKAQANIIVAEAQGESWLQRNWRPILMLVIVAIVANNFLVVPILQLFGLESVVLELPDQLYTLMTVGVGGYIAGRSGEKIAAKLK